MAVEKQYKVKKSKFVPFNWDSLNIPWGTIAQELDINTTTLYRWRVNRKVPSVLLPIIESIQANNSNKREKRTVVVDSVDTWVKRYKEACRQKDMAEKGLREAIRMAESLLDQSLDEAAKLL